MVETIKQHILKEYYIIGLLEELDLSFLLMETKLPDYLKGALEVYRGPIGQKSTYTSSTAYNYTVSDEVRSYLSRGPLRHSVDIYEFIKALFWQKIKANNISL